MRNDVLLLNSFINLNFITYFVRIFLYSDHTYSRILNKRYFIGTHTETISLLYNDWSIREECSRSETRSLLHAKASEMVLSNVFALTSFSNVVLIRDIRQFDRANPAVRSWVKLNLG